MGFIDEKLWDIFEEKVREEDADLRKEHQIGNEYISAVKQVCKYGIERADTIRDTFPMFTLHNETHICNVMQLMADLLGNDLNKLTRDEAAMLIMSACCHDIGMSYSEEEKEELFGDVDRLNQYLENNHHEYVKAFSTGNSVPVMTDDMIQNYLRSIHHERAMELLFAIEWPTVLGGKIDRENLICVCQSHGKDISSLDEMEATPTIDLRFCAILLRLADILDFDTSRAPEAVYTYSGFQKANDPNSLKSKEEWDKHLASHGFDFLHVNERTYMYSLDYSATCKSMQVEQTVNCYLDWVDQELNYCSRQLKRFAGKWQNFILPGKIKRNIRSEGYVSGQYRLSLDQDKILELFIGKDLYRDPSVFVRELIQNAIDAVRTREQLDKNLPSDWKGQINIRCWMDQEGYHWFRIEDNGIGMTEDIIMNYFLKIGSSYYSSDTFLKAKLQCNADPDYMPISRFGIGILSCFMGDNETNQVEISTKRFKEGNIYSPALRLSMHGINGYYYLSNKDKRHMPGPMKGVTQKEKAQYLTQAGTAIAVRTNLYQTGKYRGFKEIVDKYVVYPPVAIHYDGDEGSCDYLTEDEFTDAIDSICSSDILGENGVKEFVVSDDQLNKLYSKIPEISFKNPPKLLLKCVSLRNCTSTPFLKGALLIAKVKKERNTINLKLGNQSVEAGVFVELDIDEQRDKLGIRIEIIFDNDFTYQMNILDRKNLYKRNNLYNLEKKLKLQYPDDRFRQMVLRGIVRDYIGKANWKKHIKKWYKISSEILNETINEVEEFIKRNGYHYIKEDDIATLEAFNTFQKNWTFDILSLSEFKWYNKYFKNVRNRIGTYGILAHNGIFCGKDVFFYQDNTKEFPSATFCFTTIILFKDKYRPHLDVVRDGVRNLTLETASEIGIIKANLINQGFISSGLLLSLNNKNYSRIVMADYYKLLSERNDLTKRLVFDTSEGLLSNEGLADRLLNKEKIRCNIFPTLSNQITVFDKLVINDLYCCLCVAFLRENYLLQIEFCCFKNNVFISKKEKELSDDYKKIFSAVFFLPEINNNCTILTDKMKNKRYACNEYHRLSQFILKNGVKLNKYVPGIFRELLRVLAEDNGSTLIDNVNGLLESLRKFPGGLFEISEELFLSEEDLFDEEPFLSKYLSD